MDVCRVVLVAFAVCSLPFICCRSLALTLLDTRVSFNNRYTIYKDNISLADYEVRDGMNLELYYY